jgi:hypothetical protein
MADEPGEVACVAVDADAKLESVLAESGVDLQDCGLDVFLGFCRGDGLGINGRWLGRRLCFERSMLM